MFTVTRKKVKDGPTGQILYLRRDPEGSWSSRRSAPTTPACP